MERPVNNKYDTHPKGGKSNVIQLENKNFKNKKITHKAFKNKYGLLKVYAPWCGYCTLMVDDINFIADELKSVDFMIGALNYEKSKNICQELEVKSFPYIFMVGHDGTLEDVSDKAGDRSVESLLNLICNKTNEYSNNNGKCCKKVGNKIVC